MEMKNEENKHHTMGFFHIFPINICHRKHNIMMSCFCHRICLILGHLSNQKAGGEQTAGFWVRSLPMAFSRAPPFCPSSTLGCGDLLLACNLYDVFQLRWIIWISRNLSLVYLTLDHLKLQKKTHIGFQWTIAKQNITGSSKAQSFSRMRSEGSRFTWGSGGEAVFAKFCVCGRNRRQVSATVCGDAVRLSTVASASGVVLKACQVDSVAPQLYWRLQRRCLSECSLPPQLYWRLQSRCLSRCSVPPQFYWRLQRRCLSECSVPPQLYWRLQRRCLSECSESPQLYWRLQRRCLSECSVPPQFYWRLQRRCLWEWSVSPQLYWCLQRRCLWEWSVSPQLYWRLQRRCLRYWSVAPDVSVPQECQVRVSHTRVSRKSAPQECLTRVSSKIVLQECQVRVSHKSVK